jgi:hypothetical protein
MADSGYQTIGRWAAAAAICAAAFSFAHAQREGPPHPASVSFRQADGSLLGNWFAHPFGHPPTQGPVNIAHNYADSRPSAPSGTPTRRRTGQQHVSPTPPMSAGAIPYRPISESARNVPRPPPGNTARAGSIRDAITRYNEEREAGRGVPQQPSPGTHAPDPSVYRN